MELTPTLILNLALLIVLPVALVPVSYTHLDVYKRQVSKCFCIRPCALPIVVALEVYFVKLSLSEKSRSFFLFN